jgi:hypothetical protein
MMKQEVLSQGESIDTAEVSEQIDEIMLAAREHFTERPEEEADPDEDGHDHDGDSGEADVNGDETEGADAQPEEEIYDDPLTDGDGEEADSEEGDDLAVFDEEAYNALIAKYADDEAGVKELLLEALSLAEYYTKFMELGSPDLSKEADLPVATVGESQIPRYVEYYYVIYQTLSSYASNQEPSYDTKAVYQDATLAAARDQAYISYADSKSYEITETQIASALEDSLDYLESLFGEETIKSFLGSYYITDDQHKAAKDFIGKSVIAQKRIEDEVRDSIAPSEEEVYKFYDDNISRYSETVSAKHILTEDEELANEILELALALDEEGLETGFDELMDTMREDERVIEAADLGKFGKTQMVADFTEGVFSMQPGEIKTVKTEDFGYHIVYVYDAKDTIDKAEDIFPQLIEDYISDNVYSPLNAKLSDIYSSAKKKEGDYLKTPQDLFTSVLTKKFSVKQWPGVAKR